MLCPRCTRNIPDDVPACPTCGLARTPHDSPGEVDDIARTLVWQKGEDEAAPPPNLQATRLAHLGQTVVGLGRAPAPQERGMAATRQVSIDVNAAFGALDRSVLAVRPAPGEAPEPPPEPAILERESAPPASANTLIGVAKPGEKAPEASHPANAAARSAPASSPEASAQTVVGLGKASAQAQGQPSLEAQAETARRLPPAKPVPSRQQGPVGSTTLPQRVVSAAGAAPGVAVIPRQAPSSQRIPQARESMPAGELGATIAPSASGQKGLPRIAAPPQSKPRKNVLDKRVVVAPLPKRMPIARRAGLIAIAAGIVGLSAVIVVLLWPGRSPVSARPRVDGDGQDGLDLECATCPDGTIVRVGATTATVAGRHAFLPMALPLGDSRIELAIDRPAAGRDETTDLNVRLPYRVRTDLSTLRGDRPAIQVVVEAVNGTEVVLDNKPVPLVAGRAVDMLDVTEACTGEADDPKTLSRQIPYTVTPPGGTPERGTLHVSVPIVPLRITAPGAVVVTDQESFILAGRAAKGAELFAGPHAIPLRPDGTFGHRMNVSSVGATQIAVRAQSGAMAPRIVRIQVRRVESLAAAARELAGQSPLAWQDFMNDAKAQAGKAAIVSGTIVDARLLDQTITILKVRATGGPTCPALPPGAKPDVHTDGGRCTVEVVVGAPLEMAVGDVVTACGRVAGTRPEGDAEIVQIHADFAFKGTL